MHHVYVIPSERTESSGYPLSGCCTFPTSPHPTPSSRHTRHGQRNVRLRRNALGTAIQDGEGIVPSPLAHIEIYEPVVSDRAVRRDRHGALVCEFCVAGILQKLARPLEDTPNSVLRRVAGFDGRGSETPKSSRSSQASQTAKRPAKKVRTNSGQVLNELWKVNARHPLYHKDGNYYNHLRYFPGALFDPHGYVLFKSENDYLKATQLQHGTQLHVPGGISSMPGYIRKA